MNDAPIIKGAQVGIEVARTLLGVQADVYYPTESGSIYTSGDQDFTYNPEPDWSGRVLVSGIFTTRFPSSDETLSPFSWTEEEAFVYYHSQDQVPPPNSKFVFHVGGGTLTMRLVGREEFTGFSGKVFTRCRLVPFA